MLAINKTSGSIVKGTLVRVDACAPANFTHTPSGLAWNLKDSDLEVFWESAVTARDERARSPLFLDEDGLQLTLNQIEVATAYAEVEGDDTGMICVGCAGEPRSSLRLIGTTEAEGWRCAQCGNVINEAAAEATTGITR